MQDRLRRQWRAGMGRVTSASVAVIDAQFNGPSPQGGECGYDTGIKPVGLVYPLSNASSRRNFAHPVAENVTDEDIPAAVERDT
jgi:hypothetical protein